MEARPESWPVFRAAAYHGRLSAPPPIMAVSPRRRDQPRRPRGGRRQPRARFHGWRWSTARPHAAAPPPRYPRHGYHPSCLLRAAPPRFTLAAIAGCETQGSSPAGTRRRQPPSGANRATPAAGSTMDFSRERRVAARGSSVDGIDATIGCRRCYVLPPPLLQEAAAVATFYLRRCYIPPLHVLHPAAGAATSIHRRCFICPRPLLHGARFSARGSDKVTFATFVLGFCYNSIRFFATSSPARSPTSPRRGRYFYNSKKKSCYNFCVFLLL
jgi:hypothetical protein